MLSLKSRIFGVCDFFLDNSFEKLHFLIERTRIKNNHAGITLKYMIKANIRKISTDTNKDEEKKRKLLNNLEMW
jgi:hypothetical protein